MAPHNDTISRRSFLRRTSAGVSGLLIASSLPLPLKGAEKSGSAEGTDRTEAYSDTWLSDSVPTPPQRLSRIVHTLADTGFSGKWGRELKDPDWDFRSRCPDPLRQSCPERCAECPSEVLPGRTSCRFGNPSALRPAQDSVHGRDILHKPHHPWLRACPEDGLQRPAGRG